MSDLLQSVYDIYLPANHKVYYIPDYQRGYKWTRKDAQVLLDDIKKFTISSQKDDDFYCLQNITLVPQVNNIYNVVDGQQRLTTIYILLSYLRATQRINYSFAPSSLIYGVREATAIFLREEIASGKLWRQPIDVSEAKHKDEWYIRDVAQGIQQWFDSFDKEENKSTQERLIMTILHKVKLIVNDMSSGNEEDIFAGLNGGKVDLDGADLVRAELITRSAKEKYSQYSTPEKTNEFRVRIGLEIDEMNRWWADENHKKYFTQFLKGTTTKNRQFNADLYPIDLLYHLYYECDSDKEESLDFRFFEHGRDTNGRIGDHDHWELYDSVVEMHNNLKEWYDDNQIYHWLGYLFFNYKDQPEVDFQSIYRKWTSWEKWGNFAFSKKEEFVSHIKSLIRKYLLQEYKDIDKDGSEACQMLLKSIQNTQEDWYNGHDIFKILILMDILIYTNSYIYQVKAQEQELIQKSDRLPVAYLKKNNEDKEHIRSCTPNEKEGLNIRSKEDWIMHIKKLYDKSDKLSKCMYDKISSFLEKIDRQELTDSEIGDLNIIMNQYGQNSIGNLVLLNLKINRSYGNNPFQEKIQRIIMEYMKRVNFVRPYTLMVFLSIIQSDIADWRWTQENINQNANNIVKQVESFLKLQ
jgi:hypothetical protein